MSLMSFISELILPSAYDDSGDNHGQGNIQNPDAPITSLDYDTGRHFGTSAQYDYSLGQWIPRCCGEDEADYILRRVNGLPKNVGKTMQQETLNRINAATDINRDESVFQFASWTSDVVNTLSDHISIISTQTDGSKLYIRADISVSAANDIVQRINDVGQARASFTCEDQFTATIEIEQ